MAEQEEVGEASARNASKKTSPAPAATSAVPEAETNAGGPEGSETEMSVVMSRMFSGYQDAVEAMTYVLCCMSIAVGLSIK
ncbi:hypothetical protein Tco_0748244 [Tanacetum coccineum]|uniref:Uncharacterized protein n=1 Tax=Tanacetum coccineum TaxID=301880 RepID=A0ABQ4YV78_9ASTR